ncbi:hypothetical protein BV25DRAFT_1825924 [Artomyces pyxidatus]|uniref:Uncharacterized protein n=1 Tax=Artomyces pyxidatus TaxID=48021 RepID=A0ACB8T207_9AGAM|nr:hypothetical protein BV25DRAFT_1825924 [Artomyces pyxidatus]
MDRTARDSDRLAASNSPTPHNNTHVPPAFEGTQHIPREHHQHPVIAGWQDPGAYVTQIPAPGPLYTPSPQYQHPASSHPASTPQSVPAQHFTLYPDIPLTHTSYHGIYSSPSTQPPSYPINVYSHPLSQTPYLAHQTVLLQPTPSQHHVHTPTVHGATITPHASATATPFLYPPGFGMGTPSNSTGSQQPPTPHYPQFRQFATMPLPGGYPMYPPHTPARPGGA